MKHWAKSGIKNVRDIWDVENGCWKNRQFIFNTLTTKRNYLAEYEKIKSAIPVAWKHLLRTRILNRQDKGMLYNIKTIQLSDQIICINDKEIPLIRLKTKEIYYHSLYPQKLPNCVAAWTQFFGYEIDWGQICKVINYSIQNRKQKDFHWKVIHRAVYTESRLHHMGRSNGICKICELESEDISHLLFNCSEINAVWNSIEDKIFAITEKDIHIDFEKVLFGEYTETADKHLNSYTLIVNLFIYQSKWEIWKNRNSVRYGNKTSLTVNEMFNKIEASCKRIISVYINSPGNAAIKKGLQTFIQKMN